MPSMGLSILVSGTQNVSSAVSVTDCPQLRRGEKQLDVGKGFWSCKWQDLVCSWMCVMGISLILEDFESGLGDQKKVGKARPPDPWEIVPLPFAMSPIPWTKSPAEPHEKAQTWLFLISFHISLWKCSPCLSPTVWQ